MDDAHAHPAAGGAARLHRDNDQRLVPAGPAAAQPGFLAADEALVDLDRAGQQGALRVDHGAPQLVQHHPRGLVSVDTELAGQLSRRDARRGRGHQVGRPEPQVQRRAGAVQDRARRHRRLVAAGHALPQQPARQLRGRKATATRAVEPLRPPRGEQVLPARLIVGKAGLELDDRLREIRSRHPVTLAESTG